MRMRLWALALIGVFGCDCGSGGGVDPDAGADGGSDVGARDTSTADTNGADTSSGDADLDSATGDASVDGGCSLGIATTEATATNPSLFGETVPVAEGEDLPAGTYRIRYTDGCFKFASNQGWTVHARLDGNNTWWLVDGTTSEQLVILPGTVGIFVTDTAYENFDDCVAANLLEPDVLYEHDGGPLSIFLTDTNYPDNVSGVDDRNPAWEFFYEDCAE